MRVRETVGSRDRRAEYKRKTDTRAATETDRAEAERVQETERTEPEQVQEADRTEPEQVQEADRTEPEQAQETERTESERVQETDRAEPEQAQEAGRTEPDRAVQETDKMAQEPDGDRAGSDRAGRQQALAVTAKDSSGRAGTLNVESNAPIVLMCCTAEILKKRQ